MPFTWWNFLLDYINKIVWLYFFIYSLFYFGWISFFFIIPYNLPGRKCKLTFSLNMSNNIIKKTWKVCQKKIFCYYCVNVVDIIINPPIMRSMLYLSQNVKIRTEENMLLTFSSLLTLIAIACSRWNAIICIHFDKNIRQDKIDWY
jgi:hypothetical protein